MCWKKTNFSKISLEKRHNPRSPPSLRFQIYAYQQTTIKFEFYIPATVRRPNSHMLKSKLNNSNIRLNALFGSLKWSYSLNSGFRLKISNQTQKYCRCFNHLKAMFYHFYAVVKLIDRSDGAKIFNKVHNLQAAKLL